MVTLQEGSSTETADRTPSSLCIGPYDIRAATNGTTRGLWCVIERATGIHEQQFRRRKDALAWAQQMAARASGTGAEA